ncbi:MAG: DUF1592 domain-containing protein [Myxococcaceae bacterium]
MASSIRVSLWATLTALALGSCRPASPTDVTPKAAPVQLVAPELSADVCIFGRPAVALERTPPRLLTREELNNTVRDLLGDTTRPASTLPSENRTLDFENNADSNVVSPLLVKGYMLAAEEISERAVKDHLAQLVPCTDQDESCRETFLRAFTRRAFRRPATDEELTSLRALFWRAQADEDFKAAVTLTVQAVLQSPQFLYRTDFGEAASGVKIVPLTGLELATRLSFFLWASTPDEALLVAAESGALSTVEGVADQTRRLLADPRAHDSVRSFHRQWLHLDGIDSLSKNASVFPEYKATLRESWRASLDAFLEHAFWEGGTVATLFSSPRLYVDGAMAPVYGEPTPSGGSMSASPANASPRAGLLTQPALLAMLATSNQGSPVKRGVYVREKFLCQVIPPPPANISTVAPDPSPTATTRERFAQHTANAYCATCHRMIDPVGFAFESYDGLGRYRDNEHGKPLDTSGALTDTREPSIEGPVANALELSQRFAQSGQVRDCIATQWYRYAMGRAEQTNDVCSLREVQSAFARSGGNFQALLVALTTSQAFRFKPAGGAP